MVNSSIVIHKVNLPTRCEICHQIDEFDPETALCRRCSDLPLQKLVEGQTSVRPPYQPLFSGYANRGALASTSNMARNIAIVGITILFFSCLIYALVPQTGELFWAALSFILICTVFAIGGLLFYGAFFVVIGLPIYLLIKFITWLLADRSKPISLLQLNAPGKY